MNLYTKLKAEVLFSGEVNNKHTILLYVCKNKDRRYYRLTGEMTEQCKITILKPRQLIACIDNLLIECADTFLDVDIDTYGAHIDLIDSPFMIKGL